MFMMNVRRLHEQVADAECYARWRNEIDLLLPEGDALAAELAEKYPKWGTEIADLFSRIVQYKQKMSRLHERCQAGVSLHLTDPELLARGMDGFTRDLPSLCQRSIRTSGRAGRRRASSIRPCLRPCRTTPAFLPTGIKSSRRSRLVNVNAVNRRRRR